jgi:tetraacyldisaccharide 4'-kinase
MDARAWMARGLEEGRVRGPLAIMASRVWARCAQVERPLQWRDDARVVAVGGPTLGGSGKTPLAIACAEELRLGGAKVALVGHAYGATPGRARLVSPDDDVRRVGDEALVCARRLSSLGVSVIVAPTRQEALDLALASADVVVIDGLCQTRPKRATLSLLAVDPVAPWGAGHCPPRGDLRAPIEAWLAATDRVVWVGHPDRGSLPRVGLLPTDEAQIVSEGAWLPASLGGGRLGWDTLRALRLGLWTTVARPSRLLRQLDDQGIVPVRTAFGADHRPRAAPPHAPQGGAIDLWLTTAKCAAHARYGRKPPTPGGVPVATLDHALCLPSGLKERLSHLDPGGGGP